VRTAASSGAHRATLLEGQLGASWTDEEWAAVAEALRHAIDEACRRWPGIEVSDETFVRQIAGHLPRAVPVGAGLADMQLADIALCAACLARDERALSWFERHIVPVVGLALRRLRLDSGLHDELVQVVRLKLLVPSGDRPAAIASYSGRGPLERWVRVISVRVGLNAIRDQRVGQPLEDDALYDAVEREIRDPEALLVRHTRREALRQALTRSFEDLPPDARTLLRLRILDRLSLQEIASIHGVDASTISRRLDRVREGLLDRARDRLRRLVDDPSICDSLVHALQSGLDVSVARLLRDREAP
jgi:RNA polymerase sigma-70 factor (ECF subfamily)